MKQEIHGTNINHAALNLLDTKKINIQHTSVGRQTSESLTELTIAHAVTIDLSFSLSLSQSHSLP